MAETVGNSALFGIFLLSLLSLVLIPYTIYRLCFAEHEEQSVQPWSSVRARSRLSQLQIIWHQQEYSMMKPVELL